MSTTLVLGGARSGKSRFALAQAELTSSPLVMIATAEALDAEMSDRIDRHRAERGARWRTIESPLELPQAIRSLSAGECAVVDCLTLWIANLMHAGRDPEQAAADLVDAWATPSDLLLVSNEVGSGIVPDNALARRFRDEAGRMNQHLASRADRVVLVVAGLPFTLKGAPADA